MNCQGNLCKFRTHSKDCGNPHPEYSSRSADGDSSGNTGDISGTYCTCQCSTDCLERCHGTVRGLFFLKNSSQCGFKRIREFADLDKTSPQAQVKPYADNTDHSRDTPDKIIYDVIDGFNCLKHIKQTFLSCNSNILALFSPYVQKKFY